MTRHDLGGVILVLFAIIGVAGSIAGYAIAGQFGFTGPAAIIIGIAGFIPSPPECSSSRWRG